MTVTILGLQSQGPEVVDLQLLLHFRSPLSEAELGGFDGVFGAKTDRAVREFQSKRGQERTGPTPASCGSRR